jgi:hypothetical protein
MSFNDLQADDSTNKTGQGLDPCPPLEPISTKKPESATEQQEDTAGAYVDTGPAFTDRQPAPANDAVNRPSPNETPDSAANQLPAVTHGDVKFTVFEGPPGTRLTKELSLDGDDKVMTTRAPMFIKGRARTESITRLTDLEQITQVLGTNECLATGVFDRPRCEIALKADLTEDQVAAGVRARSLELMSQPSPGLAPLDFDPSPRMPEHMHCGSPTDLMEKLSSLSPLFEGIGYSGAGSASNGIINLKTGEPHTKNGFHCYILKPVITKSAPASWQGSPQSQSRSAAGRDGLKVLV